MRTRRASYISGCDGITFVIKPSHKRCKPAHPPASASLSSIETLHDELVVSIMAALSASASSPADLINAMLTCKRFCAAGTHPLVLANASVSALSVKASHWSDGALGFLQQCERSGNVEAAYTLGMIRFYCFNEREVGAALMAKAAIRSHAAALHSLAIIQFNGSGGTRKDKNLKSGASLCSKAAAHGHVDAIRELGHCLQDGYGMPKNIVEGRRLLLEANAREAAAAVAASPRAFVESALHLATRAGGGRCLHQHAPYRFTFNKPGVAPLQQATSDRTAHPMFRLLQGGGCSLLSDFGCNVPPPKLHIANKFMVDWYEARPPPAGLRLCSHTNCGRPETRRHEFRRCSACGTVNYCSRACQALDWKLRHKYECTPVEDWEDREDNDADDDDQAAQDDLQES